MGRWSAVLLRAAAGLSGPAQWWPLLVAALPPWQPTPLATSFSWLRLVALTLPLALLSLRARCSYCGCLLQPQYPERCVCCCFAFGPVRCVVVSPSPSGVFKSAPFSSSSLAVSTQPALAACPRAVRPLWRRTAGALPWAGGGPAYQPVGAVRRGLTLSGEFTSTPRPSSSRSCFRCPSFAACQIFSGSRTLSGAPRAIRK